MIWGVLYIAVVKRLPLILIFLFMVFSAWVVSPFWVKHLPNSVQKTLNGSTHVASEVYSSISKGSKADKFHPGHYDAVPEGVLYVDNFSYKLNLDANNVAHPTVKPNGNVLSAPPNDTKDRFLIQYPGQKHPTDVTAKQWNSYLKAHPNMLVRIQNNGNQAQYLIADKQWWIQFFGGSWSGVKRTDTSNPNDPVLKTAQINGDQGSKTGH